MSATPLRQAGLAAAAHPGVRVPRYDRGALEPRIAHIGVGGFVRSHLALYTENVAAQGGAWGIAGIGSRREDAAIASALTRQDGLYTLIEKGPGEPSVAIIGSVLSVRHAPPGADAAMTEAIAAATTAILSLTITEAGYAEPSAGTPTTFDRIAAALGVRRDRGAGPLTILSLDNIPANGAVTRRATLAAAERLGGGLTSWIDGHCCFPDSMVDRITPATTDADRTWLREARGLDDAWPVVAEPFRQWVLEDDFAAGRPAWERDGALFSDRVGDWERYKLRLLNAGHSSMAYLASLAGLTYVDEAMADPTLRAFVERLLRVEALPTLAEIPGHPREAYLATVLERFASRGIRDQLHRVCQDGSAKLPTFLIPTVVAQLQRDGPIVCAATALAGWARYLAVTAPGDQAFDASGATARVHAAAAVDDPRAFLEYGAVFPPELRDDERFSTAFAEAYRRVAEDGPLAACVRAAAGDATRSQLSR